MNLNHMLAKIFNFFSFKNKVIEKKEEKKMEKVKVNCADAPKPQYRSGHLVLRNPVECNFRPNTKYSMRLGVSMSTPCILWSSRNRSFNVLNEGKVFPAGTEIVLELETNNEMVLLEYGDSLVEVSPLFVAENEVEFG